MNIEGHLEEIECHIADIGNHQVVLGTSWLKTHNPSIDWKKHKLQFNSSYCSKHCLPKPQILKLHTLETEDLDSFTHHNQDWFAAYTSKIQEQPKRTLEEIIPPQYHSWKGVFLEKDTAHLPPHRPYDIKIELLPGAKIKHGPIYSTGPKEDKELRKTLTCQLEAGLIVPSTLSMASPIIFVKKKNGKLCLCVDYHYLNSITKKNVYPLPLPLDLIEKLQGAKIFTKFDLKWGYNLLRIAEGDEWKTAFKTKYRLFEYRVMPFGLTNAPAYFQHLMNDIFWDLLDICVVIYLDNILVFSKDEKSHTEQVKEVLRRLEKNDLYCNLEKSFFHVPQVEYLGFIISPDGVQVNQEKVTAALKPDFNKVAKPLYNLLKKDAAWTWGESEQGAFDGLKEALTMAPLLIQPDYTQPFFLECDSSDYATRAILSQKNKEGKLCPVAYLSKTLTPAERNYEIYDKELLAIIRAFKEWRHLLEGTELPIQVLTNHKNLEYFTKGRELRGRHACWSMFLQDYNFQIVYRPGAQNGKADILSHEEIKDLISEAIYEDERSKEILELLQKKKEVKDWELREGLLYYKGKIFVPKNDPIRNRVIESHHDALAVGHPGQLRTLELVTRTFWWPSMTSGKLPAATRH
ncbi:Transposon Tf2-1 polyprotein [Rhizoctonia solani AG-3 Rhs1AP]|uniref:Transposon Tf2-1 polyprotein n=1 Tax=Rhizoctonia solani AG-3 Rhs1AP TaxID=1086054 RepID=X8J1L0_9AGAM|nr:Transposon Tf2-1 polyprotein [Rhizoctonia solani AG-3 Rhs1AP]